MPVYKVRFEQTMVYDLEVNDVLLSDEWLDDNYNSWPAGLIEEELVPAVHPVLAKGKINKNVKIEDAYEKIEFDVDDEGKDGVYLPVKIRDITGDGSWE